MKTLQKVLVLALIALALVYAYNVINPVVSEKANLPLAVEKPKLSAPASGVTISEQKPKLWIDTQSKTAQNYKVENPPPINLDKLPAGEFVITDRAYVMTDTGIKSFSIGERVTKVEGGYTNGKITIPVDKEKLTDLRSVVDNIERQLANARAHVPPMPSAAPKLNVPASGAAIPSSVIVDPKEAYNAAINRQIEALNDKIRDLTNKTTSQINANGPVITRLKAQIQKLEASKR